MKVINKNHLEKWQPISGIPNKLYLQSLVDDESGLSLKFVGEMDILVLVVKFEAALTYRNSDEGDRLKFLSELSGQSDWSLYTLSGSEYINWFNEQSYSLYSSESIKHYLFFTPNDIVEVLSLSDPMVELRVAISS